MKKKLTLLIVSSLAVGVSQLLNKMNLLTALGGD